MQRIPKRRYTAEFRAEAVKLVVEQGAGLAEAARRLDFPAKSLANGVRAVRAGKPLQGPRATGDGPGGREHAAAGGVCAAEDGARDSPKGGGILREGCAVRYAFIEAHRVVCYRVPMMCELLEVSRSGYHAWRGRGPSPREVGNTRLVTQIRAIHVASDNNYGSPRVYEELREQGNVVSLNRVRRLMKKHGIAARHKRKFRATTDSRHKLPVAPNRLGQHFVAKRPDRVWLTDVSYRWTNEGWLYLACVLDLYSRLIVGWAMSERNDRHLVIAALGMAYFQRRPSRGVVHHSDRGSGYCSHDYQKQLKD